MKIRRFVKKRRRRAARRLEDLMAAKYVHADDRVMIRAAVAKLRGFARFVPCGNVGFRVER